MSSLDNLVCRAIRSGRKTILPVQASLRRRTRGFRPKSDRIGIYSAYYNSSAYFPTHLACIAAHTKTPFDYYVMKSFTKAEEARAFDETVSRNRFVNVFNGIAGALPCPLRHGDALQRMISLTDNEIIVVCDIDAYLIKDGWDEFVRDKLATKAMVAVIAYFKGRSAAGQFQLVAHPSFMAFRRSFLEECRLDMYEGEGNDPGYKLMRRMIAEQRFDAGSIEPLLPSAIDYPNAFFESDAFGVDMSGRPSHGFCTHYGDFLFHFWHSMNYADGRDIIADDGRVLVPHHTVRRVVDDYNRKFLGQAQGVPAGPMQPEMRAT